MVYDDRGRLKSFGSVNYKINGLGQRLQKNTSGSKVRFMYNENGNLMGEYDGSDATLIEHVWLNGRIISALKPNAGATDMFYVYTDQIGAPRAITTNAGTPTIAWTWDNNDPFGANTANAISLTYNVRLPGQYFDSESGMHYNYFRDYDPAVGRYATSDPIGLKGGLNTFGYVDGKPLTTIDPRGLRPFDEPAGGGGDVPPSNPYGLCSDNDCPFPMKLFHRGICDGQPGTCASSMHAAGIPGPYFGHSATYSKSCLLLLGLGFKATSSVAFTLGLNRAAGAGVPGAAGAAAIGNNPVVIGVGAVFALDALFEHCKCKG